MKHKYYIEAASLLCLRINSAVEPSQSRFKAAPPPFQPMRSPMAKPCNPILRCLKGALLWQPFRNVRLV
jgi:hypothetical protein